METLTNERAVELLKLKPFAIIQVVRDEKDTEEEDGLFLVCVLATNIDSEHCYIEMLEYLAEMVREGIEEIPVGISVYRCDMKFYTPGPTGYYGYQSPPYWEIDSSELLSNEPLEAAEVA